MKNIYLFLMLIVTSIYVSGQTIVDTTKQWNTLIAGPPYNPLPDEHTEIIIFRQDTIIGTNTYMKVFRSTDELMTNWSEYCYIREDSTKKVYMRSDTSSQDYLLYDMEASLNDTLLITGIESYLGNWDFYSHYMVVTSIDSVLIFNSYRKRIGLDDGTEYWINGIGSMSGILHNASGLVGGDWFQLLCFKENDTLKYQDSSLNTCFEETTNIGSNSLDVKKINIYPNPANDNLTVEITNNQLQITNVMIFDLMGKQVKQVKFKGQGKTYVIDIKGLPSGLYFVKIQTNNGTVVRKFVKQ